MRPWRPRASRLSSGRRTFTSPAPTSTFMIALKGMDILPFGPSTLSVFPATETFTFSGILIGSLPIRDMDGSVTRRCR